VLVRPPHPTAPATAALLGAGFVAAFYSATAAVAATFRTGPITRHGSTGEGSRVPARPRAGSRVPARPEIGDRTTPANDPHIIG
jgi:hypothetical protein